MFLYFLQFPLIPVKRDKKYYGKDYGRVVFDRVKGCLVLYIALCAC